MTEQEIRQLVRDAIARQAGTAPPVPAPLHLRTPAPAFAEASAGRPSHHASHGLFVLSESDGPCLIEPAVSCNHCGYCKSYGH
jgi:hypothetical protein